MKVEDWPANSAAPDPPLIDKPEHQDTACHDTTSKSDDKNSGNQLREAHDPSRLPDIDVKANKGRALSTTRRRPISPPRPLQALRDSFTGISKMTKEDREECRDMAIDWGYHDPEIRQRIEQILAEQEALEALEE